MAKKRQVLDQAMFLLGYKGLSVQELRKKLKDRDYEDGEIEATLERLLEYGYLDDDKLAVNIANHYAAKKGNRFIASKIKFRGIDTNIKEIEEQLLSEEERAQELVQGKLRRWHKYSGYEKSQKISSYLASHGFSFSASAKVAKNISN